MQRDAYVDYQERVADFEVGDSVCLPINSDVVGRVTAVWPAIGMVDVEFAQGNQRLPAEDLVRYDGPLIPPETVSRVAKKYVKKALYWAARDRQYKATQREIESGSFTCPKCKEDALKSACYKRREGVSEKLLACPSCLFLVKRSDVLGHPDYEEYNPKEPFARLRVRG